jgi:TorA maturation chaperone TorD
MIKKIKNKQNNLLKGYTMLLYFAGSMILFEPSEECLTDFWTKGILKKLPVASRNPRFIKAASILRSSCESDEICFKNMQEDYHELFSGTGSLLAPPYESVYLINKNLMLDKQTLEVKEFYETYGWKSKFRGKIPDDHLGIELLFLTIMIEKYLQMDDEPCIMEMKKEMRRFLDLHLLSWVPEWNEHIQMFAKTLNFKGIGTLIHACIEDLDAILSYSVES